MDELEIFEQENDLKYKFDDILFYFSYQAYFKTLTFVFYGWLQWHHQKFEDCSLATTGKITREKAG